MAASQTAARRRRRPRRGSLERPVNGQLYRSALLVLSLPLLIAALTVARPVPLQAPVLPPSFDVDATMNLTEDLATGFPDRSPGGSGALGAARWFREQLAQFDLPTRTEAWREAVPGLGRVRLQNVVAVVAGQTRDTIVLMAHRDNLGTGAGANDNASGTAALVELARAYARPQSEAQAGVQPIHTLVFLSTDGGAFGGLGALRYAERAADAGRDLAVVNLDTLAGPGAARIELAGDRPRSPATALVQTASRRILEQTGAAPRHADFLAQLVDLAFPLTLHEQGPFVARGIPAITLTSAGNRPPDAFDDTVAALDAHRLEQLGTSAQELLGSLDQGLAVPQGTTSYVWLGDRMVRGWALELVLIALLAPFFAAAVDLFALCRRQRIPLAPAVRALRSRLAFWLFAAIVFTCFRLLGAWPEGPARPPNPESGPAGNWEMLPLTALLLLLAAAWLVARHRIVPRRPIAPAEEVAGQTVALLALAIVALLVVATNPFALLFLLPALHVWIWLPQLRGARVPVRLAVFGLGLAGPALLVVSIGWRFGLGLDAPWYLLALVSLGYVPALPVLVSLAAAAAGGQLAAAAAGRYAPYPDARERGPRGPLRELVRTIALGARSRRREVEARRRATATGS
jgi:hypothetical protein